MSNDRRDVLWRQAQRLADEQRELERQALKRGPNDIGDLARMAIAGFLKKRIEIGRELGADTRTLEGDLELYERDLRGGR